MDPTFPTATESSKTTQFSLMAGVFQKISSAAHNGLWSIEITLTPVQTTKLVNLGYKVSKATNPRRISWNIDDWV